MLIKLCGALLVIGGCAAMGAARSRELRERVAAAEALAAALEQLETEVCRLSTPLPEALARIARASPRLAALAALERREEDSFSRCWESAVARTALGEELRAVLTELTRALARGGEPARAFAVAREKLQRAWGEARRDAAEKCRLSTALGLCAGLLLAIVLA